MLRSILVPLDGSILAERALAYATALSVPTAASLVLVRAIAPNNLADIDEGVVRAHGLTAGKTPCRQRRRSFGCAAVLARL